MANQEREIVATRGVKLKNKAYEKIEKEKKTKEEYKKSFEKRVEQQIEYKNERDHQVVEAIQKFILLASDKVLPENKGLIGADVENEVRKEVINIASQLNDDENIEANGYGSIVLLSAVCKILLTYRDRLNILEFESRKLRQEIAKISNGSSGSDAQR